MSVRVRATNRDCSERCSVEAGRIAFDLSGLNAICFASCIGILVGVDIDLFVEALEVKSEHDSHRNCISKESCERRIIYCKDRVTSTVKQDRSNSFDDGAC